ncbi:MAG: hypothetical protein ABW184_03770 [Sphingobium sp.]
MTAASPARPAPSKARALALIGSAAAVGALVIVGAILPAEYGLDPLHIGRATGIDRLWAPETRTVQLGTSVGTVQSQSGTLRSDIVEIRLDTYGSAHPSELEYKVHLRKGATLLYRWEAPDVTGPANGEPGEFFSDFHGHTVVSGKTETVADYRKSEANHDAGALTAPFDGVHGWYFQNSSSRPVTVRLHLSGFYDLIPAGQAGNEAGLTAQPLSTTRP